VRLVQKKKTLVVHHIEPGTGHGERIVFRGAANEHPNADPGDLVVTVDQRAHKRFKRKHDDLLTVKTIPLSQALDPQRIVVTQLEGRRLLVTAAPGTVIVPGAVKVIEREGTPRRGNAFEKGRLCIELEVVFPRPSEITPTLRAAVAAALPPTDEAADADENDEKVCHVAMSDSELKQFQDARATRQERREAYGRRQDEERGTGPNGCPTM
jgi:DnaJ family protein A protein 2